MVEPISKSEFEAKINEIRGPYIRSLKGKKEAIISRWKRLKQGPFDSALANELARLVHQLIGSGGSFGFHDITAAAQKLEFQLAAMSGNNQVTDDAVMRFEESVRELDQAMIKANSCIDDR